MSSVSPPAPALAVVRVLLVAFALTLVPPGGPLAAQAPPDAGVQVDRLFEPWSSVRSPGCAVAVAQHGLTVLSRAYGMADLEHGVPNTPATIFESGSVAKQFTSAAIVLLAMDGMLALEDDVRKYVPEVPDYGVTITLRHLMTHTSGLRDWGSVAGISGWGREERSHDHADVLDIVSRQTALNFPPGHQYSYSNTGYNLLAIVVARVSGMPFADFSKGRIFEPLGMEDTQWRDDYRRIVEGRSTAYDAAGGERFQINRPIEYVHGNGGLLTTVADLTTWNRALGHARFGPEFVRMMENRGVLRDGSRIVYASGLRVEDLDGVPSVTHTGSTAGYRAFLGRYPEQDLSVALLCNVSNVNPGGMGARVARIYLGEAARDPEPPVAASVPASRLESIAGLYREPVTGDPMRLAVENGGLRIVRGPRLVPLSATEFAVGPRGRRFVLEENGSGRPTIRERYWEFTDQRYDPVEPFSPGPDQLAAYAGQYHSPDAETTLRVSVKGGALVAWRRPDFEAVLIPLYGDAFEAPGLGLIRFRKEGGAVKALSLSLGRVFDMRFERVGG